MLRQHIFRVLDGCQVVDPIPFLQQVYIAQEVVVLAIRQAQTQNLCPLTKARL
jgi:hypothetical protein